MMRICLVGGIFGKPAAYRAQVRTTPETVLAQGLAERGHHVTTLGHHGPFDYRGHDVVHVHHLSYGALAGAARRVPFVYTNHRFGPADPLRRSVMRLVVARADVSVVLSETERAWQERAAPRARGRRVIPNGIDAALFAFHPPPPATSALVLLFVGQLTALKNVDVLLAALGRLGGTPAVRLRLVYQVDEEEAHLRAQAAKLGVDVEFLGPRRPEELAELYATSHALVLPSREEALPSVVSEALLVGRPVIGTAVGAVADQVGTFGRVVAPGDAGALAGAIQDLAARYAEVVSGAAEARARAVGRYSVTAMIDAHEAMYRELANARP